VEEVLIRRLLIANRGEIAVRIARTCRRLGVSTVAVYSDADRRAMHVEAADGARRIGPAEPAKSYLDVRALLEAARASGADAIHPGYGFLSENAAFAEACADAGLAFVGPSAAAIRAMGSKESSRRLAIEIGVPVVPGFQGEAQDDATLGREADRIGYPLLVKASAGGGGKGIRVVAQRADLADALAAARREAKAAFGDSTLILERYLERARHVEVQIFGDRRGRRVHLFDRDCSMQRNHQKLVEEAPAPNLDRALRERVHAAALRVAEAIDYQSAGTVEFLVDERASEFYFLEVNTRLQVEHPTTELVTGLDLVELQLRVAAGEALPDALRTVATNGVAIEARLCAERPDEGYLPSTGTITHFAVPAIDGVRVDSGIRAGSVVGTSYDSMLAKIIAHGHDREEARRRLVAALRGTVLAGVETNLDFLQDVLRTPSFREARLSTRYLETAFAAERDKREDDEVDAIAAALTHVAAIESERRDAPLVPWHRLGPWRVVGRAGAAGSTEVHLRDERGAASVVRVAGAHGRYRVDTGSGARPAEAWIGDDGALRFELEGALHRRVVDRAAGDVWVAGGERHRRLTVVSRDERAATSHAGATGDSRNLRAPFPGLVTSVEVAPGDSVEAGSLLVVMEAMKMVHSLRAAAPGAVRGVHCQPGRTVASGDLMVEFEGATG